MAVALEGIGSAGGCDALVGWWAVGLMGVMGLMSDGCDERQGELIGVIGRRCTK